MVQLRDPKRKTRAYWGVANLERKSLELAKQKKSPEEIQDDNERTNSMGLFNMAEAYRLSAMALEEAKVRSGHADSPIRFLYYHALELYLKALLRRKHSVETITGFGHKFRRLVTEAEKLGLSVMDEDREVFSVMIDTNTIIEARYIRTGPKTWPAFEALHRTCDSMRECVGGLLRDAGVMVRI